jgi:hypothetical protein
MGIRQVEFLVKLREKSVTKVEPYMSKYAGNSSQLKVKLMAVKVDEPSTANKRHHLHGVNDWLVHLHADPHSAEIQ